MFDTHTPSPQILNRGVYEDKVLGCWTGKNIGGTLGAPFEGRRETNNVSFYTQALAGRPAPNDDLDLQLVWLVAAEENGVYRLNERVLGEYWLEYVVAPWHEYGVCKANMRRGLYPPLSGACNNERWKFSNGAWIRSEIWACLFPG
ncbi:MAG: ADP-ribosylglycohydrolase family protein, partial [Lentisphaeria bacterium]